MVEEPSAIEPEGPRVLIHCDLDAFFAAVETLHHGFDDDVSHHRSDPKQGRGRGIVSTCNYAARKFGIRSAMPVSGRGDAVQPLRLALPSTSEAHGDCTAVQVER